MARDICLDEALPEVFSLISSTDYSPATQRGLDGTGACAHLPKHNLVLVDNYVVDLLPNKIVAKEVNNSSYCKGQDS